MEVYRDKRLTREAVGCFFQAGDDEGVLSCRLVCLITEEPGGVSYTENARTVPDSCPEEVPELTEALPHREREAAELAAAGLHNGEISQRLSITEHTVKQHLKNAFQKMNIDRRSKLIEMLR